MASSRIVVSGYYGFQNVGDEAVLSGVLKGLHDESPQVEVAVAHATPGSFASPYDNVRAFKRALLGVSRGADLFLSGGGSLIQDATSFRSLAYYVGQLMVARSRGVSTVVYAQGIGPLRRRLSRVLVKVALTRVDRVIVRESASYELAARMGVSDNRLVLSADQAFLLDPPRREAEDVIVVSIRNWPRLGAMLGPLAAALDKSSLPVLFVPFQPGDSVAISRARGRMTKPSRVAPFLPWPEAWETIARARAVVSMRLHGLIFAAASGVGACGLGYDPKVAAFAKEAGTATVLDLHGLTEAAVSEAIAWALDAPRGPCEPIARLVERARLASRAVAGLLDAAGRGTNSS